MSKKNQNNKIKIHIKKGDMVRVISGNDGPKKDIPAKEGKVLSVDRRNYRAVVEGANIRIKHTKPIPDQTEGGREEQEGSIHISNLMLIDPKTGDPTRIGRKRVDGKLVRYSKKQEI